MAICLAVYHNIVTRSKLILIKIGINNYSILVHLLIDSSIYSAVKSAVSCVMKPCVLCMEQYNTAYVTHEVLRHCVQSTCSVSTLCTCACSFKTLYKCT